MISEILNKINILESSWDLTTFPQKALDVLKKLKPSGSFFEFETEVAQWLLQTQTLPEQVNLYNSFGEPPITLFNNKKFAVDIYFWRKNDTLIHSHAFRGAFQVLFGQSLHEKFEVQQSEHIHSDIQFTDLKSTERKILTAGHCQMIPPSQVLIHKVCHLNNPTVTLCIRSVNDTELSQWHYLPTGLSFKKHNLTEETIKRILYFEFLYKSHPDSSIVFLDNALKRLPDSGLIDLYEGLFINEMGLGQEALSVALDEVEQKILLKKWSSRYFQALRESSVLLNEQTVTKPELKLLAHSINSRYSAKETQALVSEISSKPLNTLLHDLTMGCPVFSEEHYEQQALRVDQFRQSL